MFASHVAEEPQALFELLRGMDAEECTHTLTKIAAVEVARHRVAPALVVHAGVASTGARKVIREKSAYRTIIGKYRSALRPSLPSRPSRGRGRSTIHTGAAQQAASGSSTHASTSSQIALDLPGSSTGTSSGVLVCGAGGRGAGGRGAGGDGLPNSTLKRVKPASTCSAYTGPASSQHPRKKKQKKKKKRREARNSFLESAFEPDGGNNGGGGGGNSFGGNSGASKRPSRRKVQEQYSSRNHALILLEHYAVTEQTVQLVVDTLREQHITLRSKGPIAAEEINSRRIVDQHFYTEARRATGRLPKELNIPRLKFQTKFGVAWSQVLKDGIAYNALDAIEQLNLPESTLATLWDEAVRKGRTLSTDHGVVGRIKIPTRLQPRARQSEGTTAAKTKDQFGRNPKPPPSEVFVCGGDFLAKRNRFTEPGTSTYYFSIDWDPKLMPWKAFNNTYIGSTRDQGEQGGHSLNALLRTHWEGLGMLRQPPSKHPCVHGSLSPLHAM